MKKTKQIFFTLLLVIGLNANAQSYSDGFTINVGVVKDGVAGLINYNYFVDRHDFIESGLLITNSNFKYSKYNEEISIPYNDFTFNAGFSKNIFYNYKNTFNINIGGGGVFGYETINNGESKLTNGASIGSKSGFIYGAYVGLDLDYGISDQLSIALKANEYYHANSTLGEFLPFVGLGFRYYVN